MAPERGPAEAVLDSTVRVPDHVVHRCFGQETLLLNLESGQYHGLSETGGRLLALIEQHGGTLRDAVARLAAEYGVDVGQIEDGLADFCVVLADRGLIEISPEPGG